MTLVSLSDDEVLKRLRALVAYGRSQKVLAYECGLSTTTISRVLSGRADPPESMLALIGVVRKPAYFEANPVSDSPAGGGF
jgi:transcriptional regulator with XRE-family HTH domain